MIASVSSALASSQELLVENNWVQINKVEASLYGLAIVTISALLLYNKHLLLKQDKLIKSNSKLLADSAVHEVEVLKEKLQPHAFKNTLAHIKANIGHLNQSMESLAEMLDYILYGSNGHYVTIENEVEFLQTLLKFHSIRIEQIRIKPTIDIEKGNRFYRAPCIPHLVTAYFIENAMKHGDVSADDFLKIEVRLAGNEFYMKVINRVEKTSSTIAKNGGEGLRNLEKRLSLLCQYHSIKHELKKHHYYAELTIRLS